MNATTQSYAGFWKRFLAHLIDSIVLGIGQAILIVPVILFVGVGMSGMESSEGFDPESEIMMALIAGPLLMVIVISVVASWLYSALMEASKLQATLGKLALGIKVTDLTGNKISFGRASGRYFAKIVSSMILMIGYIMAGFTQQKQALHDIIASCLVVNK
jgi:uncharacterized RDD family membrane protein YckC